LAKEVQDLHTQAVRATLHQQLDALTRAELLTLRPVMLSILDSHHHQLNIPARPIRVLPASRRHRA
jgi:hypothetical protein